MARMAQVNKAIKAEFPELDIEMVKGRGYFYFSGSDGFGMVDSVFSHPSATSTEDAIVLAIDEIRSAYDR